MQELELQRRSAIPLYYQLKDEIRQRILVGDLRPDDRLPAEPDLAGQLGVSRGTVRQALAELEREGWVERRHGEGTFVARRQLDLDLSRFYSFAGATRRGGWQTATRVLGLCRLTAPPALARSLRQPEGADLWRVVRLRLLEGEPVMLETSHLPVALIPRLDKADLTAVGLYEWLEQEGGVVVLGAEEFLQPIVLGEHEAALLGVPAGSAALLVERLTTAAGGQPIEVRESRIRGDRCRFRLSLG